MVLSTPTPRESMGTRDCQLIHEARASPVNQCNSTGFNRATHFTPANNLARGLCNAVKEDESQSLLWITFRAKDFF